MFKCGKMAHIENLFVYAMMVNAKSTRNLSLSLAARCDVYMKAHAD